MRLLLINLARAEDRRTAMAARFAAIGQPFEVLEATDGRLLTPAERARADQRRRRWITEYPLSDNEIGCFLSHLRAMQLLLDSGAPMLAVVEDDQIIDAALPATLAAIAACGVAFDVIDLHRNFKRGEIFAACGTLMPGLELGRIGYTHMNTLGYVVSRRGAERFIARSGRFVHAVDKALHRWWANGLELYGLSRPMVATDPAFVSMIAETRAGRPEFPGARLPHWLAARALVRASDSLRKRLLFPGYVRRGKAAFG
jgi:glycosyl transferase family 25